MRGKGEGEGGMMRGRKELGQGGGGGRRKEGGESRGRRRGEEGGEKGMRDCQSQHNVSKPIVHGYPLVPHTRLHQQY